MMFLLLLSLLSSVVYAQTSCPSSVQAKTSPVAMSGFAWDLISANLSTPRDITFDSQGSLLVVEAGTGIMAFTLSNDSCSIVNSATTLLRNSSLNHGIEFSTDSNTLYASSTNTAWAWDYNADQLSLSNPRIIVTNMSGTTHSTRTLHIPPLHPNLLVVSRGSNGNLDASAASISSGHSQVKVFDLTRVPSGGYDFTTGGRLLAFGVRNEVGVTSDAMGHVWGVMNSADDLTRNGTDISQDNPAEELHNFGDPTRPQTLYFGYPNCFTVWDTSPFTPPLLTGQHWTPSPNSTFNDTTCNAINGSARLSFQAHSAPLDIKFFYPPSTQSCSNSLSPNEWGSFPCSWNSTAVVSFHGSWDRTPPTGYKVVYLPWDGGNPAVASDSEIEMGYQNLLYTQAVEAGQNNCPNGCMRPVGLAFDGKGRLYVSSDASGEIFRVSYTNSSSNTTGSTTTGSRSMGSRNRSSAFIFAFVLGIILLGLN